MSNSPEFLIKQLEDTNSRLDKEKIISNEALKDNSEFFEGIKLALDNMSTFGIKNVPVLSSSANQDEQTSLNWDDFYLVLTKLMNRELTGNNAIDALDKLVSMSNPFQWNYWYRRILMKDLGCGVMAKTVNKAVKQANKNEYNIPVFACELAQDSANHQSKLVGDKLCQIKLDGVRCVVILTNNEVSIFSRNGKRFNNFTVIENQLMDAVKNNPLQRPIVLDGEVMSSSFQDLMKQVYRKENVQANDSILYLFDMIELPTFKLGKDDTPQHVRSGKLSAWFTENEDFLPNIRCVGSEMVNLDTSDGKNRLDELKKIAAEQGYEGLILKNPNAPYSCKRTTDWLKIKPFISLDMIIIDVDEGKNKYSGMMGALVCQVKHPTLSDTIIKTNVGTGFSDKQRIDIFDCKETILGEIIEVNADAITLNQDGTYSLRFPRFKCFRGFEKFEKF